MNEKDAVNIALVILDAANQCAEDGKDTEKVETNITSRAIMYTVLFNNPKLKEHWNALIEKGLLSYDANTGRFKTSAQGQIFLKDYKPMDYDVIKTSATTTRRTTTTKKTRPIPTSVKNYNMTLIDSTAQNFLSQ